jgi:hypothetical protein
LRFASFICEDEGARRLVTESAALDALLDRAPRAGEARERALKERIVAAALRSSEVRPTVVPMPAKTKASRLPAWLRQAGFAPSPAGLRGRREWSAAALMAASLVVGVMLGSSGTFDSTVEEVAQATGYATAGDTSQLALGEDIFTTSDEELL